MPSINLLYDYQHAFLPKVSIVVFFFLHCIISADLCCLASTATDYNVMLLNSKDYVVQNAK